MQNLRNLLRKNSRYWSEIAILFTHLLNFLKIWDLYDMILVTNWDFAKKNVPFVKHLDFGKTSQVWSNKSLFPNKSPFWSKRLKINFKQNFHICSIIFNSDISTTNRTSSNKWIIGKLADVGDVETRYYKNAKTPFF